ncbi:hypothetical protein FS749_002484 [Ceratobasidium sp. UAMH 11750]|nr:hypothetical protein FS749_002484 [Ceratobasidium sp. UAMH 11750]
MENESTTRANPVIINHFMPASEVITHLRDHGCQNITSELVVSSSSQYPIASGGLGDIYHAKLRDGTQVAIKTVRLQIGSTSEGTKHLKHAARELHTWAKCEHPNVLKLLGLAVFRDQIGMVAPWMGNGSLPGYLSREPNTDRLLICVQISDGLAYLHQCGIVHGDIKGLNVLVSTEGIPVLADFGNAIRGDRTLLFATTTANAGISHRWAAPELLQGSTPHTMKSDIYALGMTILETVTGKVPYVGKSEISIVLAVVVRKELPERPKDVMPNNEQGDRLWALLVSCWSSEPNDRPNVTKVASTMRGISSARLKQAGLDSKNANGTETRPGQAINMPTQDENHIPPFQPSRPSPDTARPLPLALVAKPPPTLSNVVPWQGESSLPRGLTPVTHPANMRELINDLAPPALILVQPSTGKTTVHLDPGQTGHQRSESLGLIGLGNRGRLDKAASVQVARTQAPIAVPVTRGTPQEAPRPHAASVSTSYSAPPIPFPSFSLKPPPERQSSQDDIVLLAPPPLRSHPSLPSDVGTLSLDPRGHRSRRKSLPRSRSLVGSLPSIKPDALIAPAPSGINDRVVTSSGHKWIKGVCIGSGLLGSAYLADESVAETLRNAIERLERLQHENIVQYLDSSIDDRHLNIFLEYVPGGSIAAFLRKYGAFEEPLCRTGFGKSCTVSTTSISKGSSIAT